MTETEALVKAEIEKHEKGHEDDWDQAENETQNNILFAKKLKEELSKELFGQEQAINTVTNSMKNPIKDEKGPKATYLFLVHRLQVRIF